MGYILKWKENGKVHVEVMQGLGYRVWGLEFRIHVAVINIMLGLRISPLPLRLPAPFPRC